jgi:hypothetical protein
VRRERRMNARVNAGLKAVRLIRRPIGSAVRPMRCQPCETRLGSLVGVEIWGERGEFWGYLTLTWKPAIADRHDYYSALKDV